ncbi:cation transporter [Duganella sp.]|uniref:cation transporter n=1 Tax=Duganella sp. TaxID=1904440 RepID=UPI0031D95FA2
MIVNAIIFAVELCGGIKSGSVSLLADAVDFFGDAANYGVSLFVLGLAPICRSRTALLKGATIGGYGMIVLATAGWNFVNGTVPTPETMGVIGGLALTSNLSVALLLYAYRNGDAGMRSVWLCSRNDAIGNAAAMLAALGVFGTGSGWPDIAVACIMGWLGVTAAKTIIAHAVAEMRNKTPQPQAQPTPRATKLERH